MAGTSRQLVWRRSIQPQCLASHAPHLQAAALGAGACPEVRWAGSGAGSVVEPGQEPGETEINSSNQVWYMYMYIQCTYIYMYIYVHVRHVQSWDRGGGG